MVLPLDMSAISISNGKQYIMLENPVIRESQPKILEFFSFYCFSCYRFEEILNITNGVQKKLPKHNKIIKYHLGSFGNLGRDLTRAWAIAMAFGIEDKIIIPMFKAVQKDRAIQTIDDIRKIFIEAGVKKKDYDAAWNSFMIKSIVIQQDKMASNFHLTSIPIVFVDGKYQINLRGMNTKNITVFTQQFIDTLQYLVKYENKHSFNKVDKH